MHARGGRGGVSWLRGWLRGRADCACTYHGEDCAQVPGASTRSKHGERTVSVPCRYRAGRRTREGTTVTFHTSSSSVPQHSCHVHVPLSVYDGGCTRSRAPDFGARSPSQAPSSASDSCGAMGKEPKSRIHACPQCDYKTGEGNLSRHVRTVHEQRRDHACPQCDAAFGQAGHLRTHVRVVHEQRRDHACPQCDAAFGRAGNLSRHVRTVHEQRRDHACPQCDAAFGAAQQLRVHVRTVHEQHAAQQSSGTAHLSRAGRALASQCEKGSIVSL